MIRRSDRGPEYVVGYEIEDEVTKKDIEIIGREMKALADEHGKVSLLLNFGKIPSFSPGAAFEDLKLAPLAGKLDKYALVTDSSAGRWAEKIGDAVIGGELKQFDESQIEEAWAWVSS